jgi:hypothetical protein
VILFGLDFRTVFHVLLLATATGYCCRVALGWVSRPSPETAKFQESITTGRTLLLFAVVFLLLADLAGYPAMLLVPAWVYLLLRLFWFCQTQYGPGVATRLQLFLIARAGEAACLATLWFLRGKPLS